MGSASPPVAMASASPPTRLRIPLLSEIFQFWMSPVMARRGAFDADSLPLLPEEDSAENLLARLQHLWAARAPGAKGDGRALATAVLRLLSPRLPLIGLWPLLEALANFSQPLIISAIVRDLRLARDDRLGFDVLLVVLLAFAAQVGAVAVQQVLWMGARCGLRAKISLSAAVYAKTIRLSNAALLQTSAAQATNLVGIDAARLELTFTFFHLVWTAPFNMVVLAAVLGSYVGTAVLPGLGVLLVLFVTIRLLGERVSVLRAATSRQTDARVKLMRDVLTGSEALRVHAWEGALIQRIGAVRGLESHLVWKQLALMSSLEALIFFAPGVTTFAVLVTCAATSRVLQVETAYLVLGLCNIMVKQFNTFPRAVKSLKEGLVALRRIERFLMLPEVERGALSVAAGRTATAMQGGRTANYDASHARGAYPSAVTELSSVAMHAPCSAAKGDCGAEVAEVAEVAEAAQVMMLGEEEVIVLLDGVSAAWSLDASAEAAAPAPAPAEKSAAAPAPAPAPAPATPFMLHNVSVSVRAAELCFVAGEVGSGKSSLLELLLGEMAVHGGHMYVHREGGVGFVPQSTWMLAASVRDNILLGRPFDALWYEEVVECCALQADLASFASGDATEVGERGLTVSGGQKARIALARALYGKPALLLLDDPLSAVDAGVAHHLVEHALIRLARTRLRATVVLVSHQLQFAEALADAALVLSHGRVLAHGTPADLKRRGLLQHTRVPSADAPSPAPAPAAAADEARAIVSPPEAAAPADAPAPAAAVATSDGARAAEASDGPKAAVAAAGGAISTTRRMSDAAVAAEAERASSRSKNEAVRFYARQLSSTGCAAIFGAILGLATCRALADWALGRWIAGHGGAALYACLTGATVAFGFGYALAFTRVVGAASRIHALVLHRVLHAPKSFFDTTPIGLLLNLFSKDMDTLDELLPIALSGLTKCVTIVGTAMLVAAVAAPAALAALPVVWLIFRRLTRYFLATSSVLKTLDKSTSGPLFSLYAESLNGVTSIRAFGLHAEFERLLTARLDRNHRAHFLWVASGRWFALRLDWLTAALILVIGLCILGFRSLISPSLAALALVYILQMASLFQWGFRMWAEVNNHFVSVERALGYTRVPQEAAAEAAGDAALAARSWPVRGVLRFADVQMRYRPGLPLVLRGASFEIGGGVKAAVVGRSGAGKSSLAVALLRLAELEGGAITIDGVALSSVGLTLLRRSITFIQQEAVLFAGTIGSNLDPFSQHTPAQLDAALEAVDFARLSGSADGAALPIAEAGANLSAGTRQLVMLARALLQRSQLLLMDEATANCDYATDAVIQRVVRTQFASSTLLTIAHRLDTIIDYDQVLLMADGVVAESGRPIDLLDTPDSLFGDLVGRAGQAAADRLRSAARAAADGRDSAKGES